MVISQSTAVILFPYSAHLDAICLISRHHGTLFFPLLLRNRSSENCVLAPPPPQTAGHTHAPSSEEPRTDAFLLSLSGIHTLVRSHMAGRSTGALSSSPLTVGWGEWGRIGGLCIKSRQHTAPGGRSGGSCPGSASKHQNLLRPQASGFTSLFFSFFICLSRMGACFGYGATG